MAATAAIQQNTAITRGVYFIGIARRNCLSSSGLTASALFQSGLLAVTNKLDDDGNKINTMTRLEIKEKIGVSPATVSRNNKRLKNSGTIRKSGVSTYVVYQNNVTEDEEIKQWYCPTELLTEPFPAKDDDGNDIIIYFTYSDALVYAVAYTLLPHTGKNKRTLKMSFDEIAELVGIDPSTVSVAVRKLRQAGLIHFPNGWCGKNRYKKSKMQLKRGFSWFKREAEYRALLAKKKEEKAKPEPTDEPTKSTSTNAATVRKIYYSIIQTEKEKKAAQALSEALNNKDYLRLNDELAATKFKYNDAIIRNNDEAQQELAAKIKGIEGMQASVLKNIGIEPEKLKPEYYVVCSECGDTGAKQDGTACNCWKNRRCGAPPGNGKRTTKGIE